MNRAVASGNLLAGVPARLAEEQVSTLAAGGGARVTRIVSTGHATGWQAAEDDEWVLVLSGWGELRFADGDRLLRLAPGDWCHIPAGARHRVERTDPAAPTVWLAVHFPADDASCPAPLG
jgi:cupin 2 domain-containing protein